LGEQDPSEAETFESVKKVSSIILSKFFLFSGTEDSPGVNVIILHLKWRSFEIG
jgi:hypothetical protein